MRPPRSILIPLLLLIALATPASAQDSPGSGAVTPAFPPGFDQVIYKGLVGNVLDVVPMNASNRLYLQRTNAVVSNTFFGRSLAVLAGLSNPVLLLGGFAWGVWSAASINLAEAGAAPAADPGYPGRSGAAPERVIALLPVLAAVDDAPAYRAPAPVLPGSNSALPAEVAAGPRPRVIKIWLAQRSSPRQQSQ